MWWRARTGRRAHRPPRAARGRTVIEFDKALDVRAPVRDVFGACARVEQLPELVPHLEEARPVAVDRHHWVMKDGADGPIEWDTVITRFGANQIIAWETPPGSVIRHAGRLVFRTNPDGGTRVSVVLSYVLPPGAFGERVRSLLVGEELDDALRRWRARLERRPAEVGVEAPAVHATR